MPSAFPSSYFAALEKLAHAAREAAISTAALAEELRADPLVAVWTGIEAGRTLGITHPVLEAYEKASEEARRVLDLFQEALAQSSDELREEADLFALLRACKTPDARAAVLRLEAALATIQELPRIAPMARATYVLSIRQVAFQMTRSGDVAGLQKIAAVIESDQTGRAS